MIQGFKLQTNIFRVVSSDDKAQTNIFRVVSSDEMAKPRRCAARRRKSSNHPHPMQLGGQLKHTNKNSKKQIQPPAIYTVILGPLLNLLHLSGIFHSCPGYSLLQLQELTAFWRFAVHPSSLCQSVCLSVCCCGGCCCCCCGCVFCWLCLFAFLFRGFIFDEVNRLCGICEVWTWQYWEWTFAKFPG